MNTTLIFVYGTLRPGEAAEWHLGEYHSVTAGIAAGNLLKGSYYGADFTDEDGPGIPGFVVEVERSQLPGLDGYEGDGYDKVEVTVHTLAGQVRCLAYQWNGRYGSAEPVVKQRQTESVP